MVQLRNGSDRLGGFIVTEAADLPFDDAWLAEVQRRSAEIDAGTATLTPWPEVKQRVRKRLEERQGKESQFI